MTHLSLEGSIKCSHDHCLASIGHLLTKLNNVGKLQMTETRNHVQFEMIRWMIRYYLGREKKS